MLKINFCRFICAFLAAISINTNYCLATTNSTRSSLNMNDTAINSTLSSTFCIGRFLIDVPTGSNLSGGNYKYDHIVVEPVKTSTIEEFERVIAARELKLKSATNKRTNQSMLLQSMAPQTDAKILASWDVDVSTAAITIDGYRLINGNLFRLEDTVGGTKQDLGMKSMQDALLRLRPRSDIDIPTDPGYCFAGGFIANPRWRNEEAGVDIDIAGHPDAFVSVWIYPLASHKKDRPLLERMGGIAQALGNLATSVHVLRKGDRQIGPYKGQEHLASAPNSGGMRGHAFVWETQGDGTLDTPAIKIELTTGHQDSNGNPQQTSLTDQQAIKLWDDILNSFRLRPTGPVKTSALAPEPQPLLPLGELVATGRACPQTGWWQTVEAGEIAGGRRKRFAAGDQMPDVVLLGASSVWQKLKGERPSHRTATLWKLVGYDEADTNSPVANAGHNVNADARREG